MILSIWAISCTSSPKNKTAPKITPPDPYTADGELVLQFVPDGSTITADGNSVLMPYWYWEKIFDYIVDTQAAQDIADTKAQKK